MPERAPTGLTVPVASAAGDRALLVQVHDADRGVQLARQRVTKRGWAVIRWQNPIPGPKRIRVEFSSDQPDPARAPGVFASLALPLRDVTLLQAGPGTHATRPLLLITYPWPSRWLLTLWIAAVPAALLAWRNEGCPWLILSLLGMCGAVTSTLLWQQNYSRFFATFDADRYGEAAAILASSLVTPATRQAALAWLRDYPHSHNALISVVMSIPIAFGADVQAVYVAVSTICGVACLWLTFRLLRHGLALSPKASLVGAGCFGCHLAVLRAFSRPIPDILGVLLTLAMLNLLLDRFAKADRTNTAGLAGIAFVLPFARPQGIAYIPFLYLGAMWADRIRTGTLSLTHAVATGVRLVVCPTAALFALYLAFGWFHNFQLMIEKAARFRDASTLVAFVLALVAILQFLPVMLIWIRRRWGEAKMGLLLAWALYYGLMLVGVRAPFWVRHFLPVIPVAIALVSVAVHEAEGRQRFLPTLLAVAFCILNVLVVVYQILLVEEVPRALLPFTRT